MKKNINNIAYFFFGFIVYGFAGFYVAYSILKIDHTCG